MHCFHIFFVGFGLRLTEHAENKRDRVERATYSSWLPVTSGILYTRIDDGPYLSHHTTTFYVPNFICFIAPFQTVASFFNKISISAFHTVRVQGIKQHSKYVKCTGLAF